MVFSRALVLARSTDPLPEDWLDRTRTVGRAASKTFTPMLGTALLAKATDDSVDALSLREDESHKGYSARSLAKEVLVPCCVRAGIDIRNKGAEPLNNQPFLRAARVSTNMKVKPNAVDDLKYLVATLQAVDFLRGQNALRAFAAFLRARIEATTQRTPIDLGDRRVDLPSLQKEIERYLNGDSEGGRTGQAMAAAILDLVFADVRTKRINDPSSKWPGDVGVFDRGVQTLSVEVKQRPMTEAEVLLFAQRISEAAVHRGFVVALGQAAAQLDPEQLAFQAHRLHGVDLAFFFNSKDLLAVAIRFCLADVPASLANLPLYALKRLEEIEVSSTRVQDWARIFEES